MPDLTAVFDDLSIHLARRTSRRGMLGLLGRTAVVVIGGGAIAEGLLAQPALAACSAHESIACQSGLCSCHGVKFCDCCATTGGGCSGGCVTKTNCHPWGSGTCSCCFNNADGAYCSSGSLLVKCRTYSCYNPLVCC